MDNNSFKDQLKLYLQRFWHWLRAILGRFGHWLRLVNQRFHLIRWCLLIGLVLFLCISVFYTYKAKTADVQNLKSALQTTTTIYDADNQKAGSLYAQKGTFVELDQISENVQNAVISTEDRSFYSNPGFDIKGILRSVVSYVVHRGQITGGGSTITQQLAKNALLTQKQTFARKLEEIFLAVEINRVYSKKDILAMYLNNAYFGSGVWGVQDAANKYFGKNASELTLSEGATFAAILRSPSFYNPIDHMDNAISRRNLVLDLMVDNGKITKTQADTTKQTSLALNDTYTQEDGYKYPYFFDAVIDEAVNKYGLKEEDIMNKGYRIYTTLDQSYQKAMQSAFEQNWAFPANAADGTEVQGGSIAINPTNGYVSAVVGGRGEHVFRGLNRATQIKRQPGSTMKPLAVYEPALEAGYHYDSVLQDKLTSYGKNNYRPANADNQYAGEVPMYVALAQSKNAPAVWLLDKIGLNKGVASVEKFGINVPKSDQNLALGFGGWGKGVSPYQMARAYTAFANEGKLANTHFIRKVVDATGAVIVDNSDLKSKQIISKKNAKEMTSMMLDVFNNGTGQTAKPSRYQVAGKTGSTEVPSSYGYGTKDQWIVGYTPNLVVATWIGFDSTDANHFLAGTSEQGVAPIFKLEMEKMLPNAPTYNFDTKSASTIAAEANNNEGSSGNWFDDIGSNIQDGIENGKNALKNAQEKANEWYNDVKSFFSN
ncbi:PBP1A family penicillin-binding protein [Agrilactobacillus yilanensis]|uniref:PBP1A family penicillin-binding protein n=1 Tax=Agrilactobacillus yilanensis TaxID=2485997 RepID=A0ABW4JC03_9LACO